MTSTTAASRADVEATRLLLDRMGIPLADLQAHHQAPKEVPTIDEYLAVVSAAVRDSSRRAYRSYWKRAHEKWADR
ncbi:integrase, partial [Dactylosporangium sucinum]